MRIKKLLLRNIRSYREAEINFPEGSTLIAGDVGAGKTSILLALEYSLFGLQPGQRGASLLRNHSNFGSVKLELDIDGKNIIIERKLRRSSKSVTNEYASIIVEDEKTEASLTEIKTKVLEYMGYPKELIKKNNLLYRYTVYTPQEQMKQIILEDSETRLNILRHILGIEKYKRIRENLVLLINQLKEESKILQVEVRMLDEEKLKLVAKKQELCSLEKESGSRLKELNSRKNSTIDCELEKANLETKLKERDYLIKEIEKTKIMLSGKFENRSSLESQIEEIKKSLLEVGELFEERKYNQILMLIGQKNQAIDALNISYTNLLTEITSLESQRKENMTKRDRMSKLKMCPTCLQDVPEEHKHNILNETENILSRTKKRIEFLEQEVLIISKKIDQEKEEKKKLEEQRALKELLKVKSQYIDNAKKKLNSLNLTLIGLNGDISLLEGHVASLKEKALGLSKFENLLKIKMEQLKSVILEERKAEVALAEINREISLTIREIKDREDSVNTKELSKKSLASKLELHDWLSINFLELIGYIERNVLLLLRQEFSNVFCKWFNMLVSNNSLSARLDESFSPIILHKDIEMEYSFLSGGERTAIALAYRLALNQTINSMFSKIKTKDIVILDEPTDGFSELQLERMREVLQELKVSQLIIVSHEQKIESFVDNVLRIKKSGDSSNLDFSSINNQISFNQSQEIAYPAVLHDSL